jgi:hypothetical protein
MGFCAAEPFPLLYYAAKAAAFAAEGSQPKGY